MRHEVKTEVNEVYGATYVTYGEDTIHHEYFIQVFHYDEGKSMIMVMQENAEYGAYEIVSTDIFNTNKSIARYMVGKLMADIVENHPHHYEALRILTDYAEDYLK